MKKKKIVLFSYIGVLALACIAVMLGFFIAYTIHG